MYLFLYCCCFVLFLFVSLFFTMLCTNILTRINQPIPPLHTDTLFRWGNGEAVNSTMWHEEEPRVDNQTMARMVTRNGVTALTADKTNNLTYFVCQGYPGW